MAMERAMFSLLFVFIFSVAVEGKVGTHILISEKKTWNDSQAYCREHHTDLSYISSQDDNEEVRKTLDTTDTGHAWIGLQRDLDDATKWRWSVGGSLTYENWAHNEPNNHQNNENNGGILHDGLWYDQNEKAESPFCCIQITISEERKAWEEALEHCRGEQKDLVSIDTENDQLFVQSAIQKNEISGAVWIGLRFLPDRWLWVNGNPLVYEAWAQEDDNDRQCPFQRRCGAFEQGSWKARDCAKKLHFICN